MREKEKGRMGMEWGGEQEAEMDEQSRDTVKIVRCFR